MPALRDLTGQRFGRLIVREREPSVKKDVQWRCLCDCGQETIAARGNLLNGSVSSCSCLRNTQGGHTGKHRLWKRWSSMIDRCTNPNSKDFRNYGGRGIKVCERWLSFPCFLEDMERSFTAGSTLEREENDGNYEPSNVTWASVKEQRNNTRRTTFLDTPFGRMSRSQAAERAGIPLALFISRHRQGWTISELFDPRYRVKLHKSRGRFTKAPRP